MVVFHDTRSGGASDAGDIFATRVAVDGSALDPDGIPVCTTPSRQLDPDVTFDGSGYTAVWFDSLSTSLVGSGNIRAARLSTAGSLIDGPASACGFAVNESEHNKGPPRIASVGGRSLIVWHLQQYDPAGIFAALLSENATLDGSPSDEGLWITGPAPADAPRPVMPELVGLSDRALVVWVENTEYSDQFKSLDAALVVP